MSTDTIGALARAALIENDNDVEKAKACMKQRFLSDSTLLHEIADMAADMAIRRVASGFREQALRQAFSPETRAESVRRSLGTARAKIAVMGILDMYIVAGKPLRQASADDLRKQISHDKAQSETLSSRAAYLTAVLKGMTKGKTVGQCYSNEKLDELARRFHLPAAA